MEQNSEDLTQNLKFESSEMDIVGSVLKVKSTPLLTQIKKPDGRHEIANYDEHDVQIKHENQELDRNQQTLNTLPIEKSINYKLKNEEIRSYIREKQSKSKENSPALKERYTKKANIEKKNICEICKKSFSRKDYLKLHVKTVHDEVKGHKCDICGKPFCQSWELRIHAKTVHNSIKPHKCVSCNKRFG